MRIPSLLVVALLLSPLAATVAAGQSGTVTITLGGRAEVLTLNLRSGESIDFGWTSTQGPVRFRVERVSDAVEIFTQTGQVGQGTVPIPTDGSYIFSFRNENLFSVTVTWTITRRPDVVPWIVAAIAAILVIVGILAIMRERRRRMGLTRMPPQGPQPPMPPTP